MAGQVKTRFAPSPTGFLHIGGVRTALFAWLFARHHGGEFALRIEDTDRERSTAEAVDVILEGLSWLGLNHDGEATRQSRRGAIHQRMAQQLLDEGRAYHCYCNQEELEAMRQEARAKGEKPRYNRKCRDGVPRPPPATAPALRFKNPLDGEAVVDDLIQGRVVIDNRELDDLIIVRSDGAPTYNLTVVADDAEMGITHVVRGDDHLNNAPRQINIFKALGLTSPRYAHVPLVLAPGGKKLSKRHEAASVLEYRRQGFLPEALLNYLVRLGWSHGDQEIFTVEEMIDLFDLKDVNKAAAALNPEKLIWLNQRYLRASAPERIAGLLEAKLRESGLDPAAPPDLTELAEAQKERVKTLEEMARQSRFFYEDPYQSGALDEAAAKKHLRPEMARPLQALREALAPLDPWSREAIHEVIASVAAEQSMKFGKIAQPLRVATTGGTASPSIDVTLQLLGRDKTLARLAQALARLEGAAET